MSDQKHIWNRKRFAMSIRSAMHILKQNGGHILYYGSVAVVLVAVAIAAERYRVDPEPEAMVLPAVDVSTGAVEEKLQLSLPEGMALIRGYAAEPFWNAMLGQWECHGGADYSLKDDTVISLCDGSVTGLGRSARLGGFIEISAGELLLRYASLAPAEDLQIGERVRMGDRLGTADAGMTGEAWLGAHLHLESEVNGVPTDPAKILEECVAQAQKSAGDS